MFVTKHSSLLQLTAPEAVYIINDDLVWRETRADLEERPMSDETFAALCSKYFSMIHAATDTPNPVWLIPQLAKSFSATDMKGMWLYVLDCCPQLCTAEIMDSSRMGSGGFDAFSEQLLTVDTYTSSPGIQWLLNKGLEWVSQRMPCMHDGELTFTCLTG